MGEAAGRDEGGDANEAALARALCATARLALKADMAGLVTTGAVVLDGARQEDLARLAPLMDLLDGAAGRLVREGGPGGPGLFAGIALRAQDGTPIGRFVITREQAGGWTAEATALFDGFARMAQAQARLHGALDAVSRRAALHRLLADNTTDTIVRGRLDGIRVYISPSVRTLLGYEPEELIGRRAAELVHPDDAAAFGGLMADVRAGRIGVAVSEQRQRHRNGAWVWLEAFVKLTHDPVTGEPDGYVASVRDISRRKDAELRLQHLATHDSLTGLPNRAVLNERLDACIAHAATTGAEVALLCLDLDHFKRVNDAYGHAAGDALLCAMAERCRAELGPDDLMARLGGDEFAILHPGAPAGGAPAATSAADLARRLISAMATPFDLPAGTVQVGLSVGIALSPAASADDLMRRADHALYCAKRQGRGTLVLEGLEAAATV